MYFKEVLFNFRPINSSSIAFLEKENKRYVLEHIDDKLYANNKI